MKFTDLWTQPRDFFDNLDTSRYVVRCAVTKRDHINARSLRNRGYRMYHNDASPIPVDMPLLNETTFLVIENDLPVGTLRVLDRSSGKIELDNFFAIDSLLSPAELPCAEATRFTIPSHPESLVIKLLLWKAFFDFCQKNSILTMLISSRPFFSRMYRFLAFVDIGPAGEYKHPHMKNKVHRTFKLNLKNVAKRWRKNKHPLYGFMRERVHNVLLESDNFDIDNIAKRV